MIIRTATLSDKERILELARLLHLPIPHFVWDTEAFVSQQIAREEYVVGEKESTIVGAMSLRQRAQALYIETLVIDKDTQASGLGSEFIQFARQIAKAKGADALRACTFTEYNNTEFYRKQSFSLLPEQGTYNGHTFWRFEMPV